MSHSYGGLVPDWLAARAAVLSESLALLIEREVYSFSDLDRGATVAAQRLAGLGVKPGDRVAVCLTNGLPLVELVHGAGRAGAILVPLNVRLAAAELAWQIVDCRASLLIYDSHSPPVLGPHGTEERLPATLSLAAFARQAASDDLTRERVDLDSVHSIMYTSGTAGRPKGAMLTYGNHWWSAVGSALNLGLREDDRWLAVLPLFHVGGIAILMRSVIYGVPAIVHDRFDAVSANRSIDEDGVTIVSVVATMLRRMLDARGDRPYPPALRAVLLGGGPVPPSLIQEFFRRGVPVVQTYGLTETASQAVTLSPRDALRKPGSAGKPLLPLELRIERLGRTLPPEEDGEIALRGPMVTSGYFGRPDETARVLREGWFHTGDIGRLDQDGYLYVLDRRDDLIVSGGENVYPAEIEAVLLSHPAVAEAGVVGEDDKRWGAVPVAFVVMRTGANAATHDLINFCREHLAGYKIPARVYVVPDLPRNAAGKLQRRLLARPIAAGPNTAGN